MLKNKIQPSKFENLLGFIKLQAMGLFKLCKNQAASPLANREMLQEVSSTKWKILKGVHGNELPEKEEKRLFQAGHFPVGGRGESLMQMTSSEGWRKPM